MGKHFKYGTDPPPMMFDRGCVTSQNMISMKNGVENKAERMMREMEELELANIKEIKMENSLMCQLRMEQEQEIEYLKSQIKKL